MDSDFNSWDALKAIFARAVDLAQDEREAYLQEACADDTHLRSCVDSLLALDEEPSRWLRSSVEHATAGVAKAQVWQNRLLGPYRVLEELGEGGMGAVYLAERADGEYQQQVAIKVVGRGPLTLELRRRFLVERQILARLDHPNIARFLDGGTDHDGIPYLVMELIQGKTITTYCREQELGLEARLRLFQQVLSAVDYAHRNLVVHRDLKPSNIFVTGDGTVKLLDFGIAKLLDEDGEPEGLTRTGQRPMTPDYASPEQFRGQPVTTASDVYSLGVVLYQLLAGRRPDRGKLRDETPPAPSRVQGRPPGKLRTDLDRVVLKAIAADPRERYGSVAQLSDDLRRYLRHEPVTAMPPSTLYQLRKFLRRQRGAVAAAVLVLLAIAWGLIAKSLEAEAARRAELETRTVVDFLVDLFELSTPSPTRGTTVTARELLDLSAEQVDERLAGNPRLQARLQHTLGEVYFNLGLYQQAADALVKARDLRREEFGPRHPRLAETFFHLGRTYQLQGKDDLAEEALLAALEIHQQGDDPGALVWNLHELSVLYRHQARFPETREVVDRALEIHRTHPELSEVLRAATLDHDGMLLWEQDRAAEARPRLDEALAIRERFLGADHPDVATNLNSLAIVVARLDRMPEARDLFRRSLEIRERIMPSDHPSLGQSLNNLAQAELALGNTEDARRHLERAIAVWERSIGPNHRRLGLALSNLGRLQATEGRPAEAEATFHRSIELLEEAVGGEHLLNATPLQGLADLLHDQGRHEEAIPYYARALTIREALLPAGHTELVDNAAKYAACLRALGRDDQAAELESRSSVRG